MTYKVLHGSAMQYLGPVVRVADLPGRHTLRSAVEMGGNDFWYYHSHPFPFQWIIRDVITASSPLYHVPVRIMPTLAEIDKLLTAAPNKTCQLNPAQTWLVVDVIQTLRKKCKQQRNVIQRPKTVNKTNSALCQVV